MSREILEKNLLAMEKWYSSFADMIRDKKDIEDDIRVRMETSWDGEVIFRVQKEDIDLYLEGKRNTKEPVEMWMERLGKIPKYAPVFLFGVGNGSYLKALISGTPKEVNVVVYEPSINIFLKLLDEIDLSEEIENRPIGFIVEELNAEEFEAVMNKVFVFENMEFLKEEIHPNYKALYGEKLVEKIRILQRKAESMMMNYNTGERFSTHIANNILSNMQYICEGYHTKGLALAIPHTGPAILVSAGPSLNKNVQELKKAKNKAFILAVDTAIKPLIKAGVVPDAFMTIDAKKPLHLTDIKGAEDIPVIAPACAHHPVLAHQKGKKIFYNDDYEIPNHIYRMNGKVLPSVSTGGSVACSAFSLLYKMGFETIILVGQDLAYTDNKSHADGSFQDKMPKEDTKKMIRVKGNYVDEIPTRRDFRVFLEWFEMYIKKVREHHELRVINATEGGAYIEGTELSTLKDVIEELCVEEVDFGKKINEMESAFSAEEREKIVEYLHSIPGEYEQIRKDAQTLGKIYKKLDKLSRSGNMGQENARKLLKRVKKLTGKCSKKETYQLIAETIKKAEYIIRTEYFYEGDTFEDEIREIARKGILYSEILQECAELLKVLAEETLLPIN